MSEQGDKARKALHDMRWGPHIDDPVERQEIMDDAIKVALGTVAALEARLSKMEEALEKVRDNTTHMDGKVPQHSHFVNRTAREALAGDDDE